MDDSERFKVWLRRFSKICLKACFREARKFCNNFARYFKFQDLLSIGTLVFTGVMVWTLVQNHQTLLQSQRQLESTITPVIDAVQSSNIVRFVNVGSVSVTNVELLARIIARYPFNSSGVPLQDYRLQNYQFQIAPVLNQGDSVAFDFKTVSTNKYPVYDSGLECYCLVFRYFRTADMKPEYKFVYFYREVYNLPTDLNKIIYVYKPIGIGETPIDGNEIPLGQVRPELRGYALQQLDLTGYEEK